MSRSSRHDPGRPTKSRLLALIERLRRARLTVVGDVVLDIFEFGEIARVSREAPVLILEHRKIDYTPGGAANVAANLAAVGASVSIVGRIGRDEAGAQLKALLRAAGVTTAGLVVAPDYPTPTKRRILAGSAHTRKQQIVRIDRGRRDLAVSRTLRAALQARTKAARRAGRSILIADYGYGLIDPSWTARLGRGRGVVTLDSRFALERFAQVDAATPNLEELERAIGRKLRDQDDRAIDAAGETLRRRAKCAALLVTRGSRGMTLIEQGRPAASIAVFGSDEVADVTGAGDTVIAIFTAARAAGGSWREAAELANVAGGLVVMKSGTATVTRPELERAIRDGWRD